MDHPFGYTVTEIAKLTGKDASTIRRHLEKKLLIGHKTGGQWRVASQEVRRYLESRDRDKHGEDDPFLSSQMRDSVQGLNAGR